MTTILRQFSMLIFLAAIIGLGFAIAESAEIALPAAQQQRPVDPIVYRWVFGAGFNAALAQQQLDSRLRQRISDVTRLWQLDEFQKHQLQEAGKGDVKRLMDRIHEIGIKYELVRNDPAKVNELAQEAEPIRQSLQSEFSRDESLFVWNLKSILTVDEFAKYEMLRAVFLEGGFVQTAQLRPDEIVEIALFGTAFANDGLARLSELPSLQSLLLNRTRVTDAGLAHLKGLMGLKQLWLRNMPVAEAGLANLTRLKRLEVLRLDGTQVTDAALAHVGKLSGLRELWLQNTPVTDDGLANLKGLANLQWLSLAETRVTDRGLQHLRGLARLNYLDLERTQVTDEGLMSLKGLSELKYLDLRGTRVTDTGLVQLQDLTNLQGLYLRGTRVTNAGLVRLQALPRLEEVVLFETQALPTKSSRDDPARALPRTADRMEGEAPGQVRQDNDLKLKLVWCPRGFVTMANQPKPPDEIAMAGMPPRVRREADVMKPMKVLISRGFWLGKYEVTQAQWKQNMATEPWKDKKLVFEGDHFPASYVNWNDAVEFCTRFTEQERIAGRLTGDWEYTLPTEAQWEYACRARTETQYSFGDDESKLGQYAWIRDNARDVGEEFAHEVGLKGRNPWGLHDMHGNLWEWCRDAYIDDLPGGRDPEVKMGVTHRVDRGGCWWGGTAECPSSRRDRDPTELRDPRVGFRIALSPVPHEDR